MKKALFAALLAAASALPMAASAQGSRTDWSMSGNFSIVSDYRFRSISQTYKHPAVQGGFDLGHSAGFYVGTWGSSVSGNQFTGGAGLEWDFYGGYKMDLGRNLTLDLGFIYYFYPGAKSAAPLLQSYDTTEVYAGINWGGLTAKVNFAISDSFGLIDSSGSYYADVTYVYPFSRTTNLVAHVGRSSTKNYEDANYTDYKLGVTTEALGLTWGLSYIGNTAEDNLIIRRGVPPVEVFSYNVANASDGVRKSVSKDTVVFSVGKTF